MRPFCSAQVVCATGPDVPVRVVAVGEGRAGVGVATAPPDERVTARMMMATTTRAKTPAPISRGRAFRVGAAGEPTDRTLDAGLRGGGASVVTRYPLIGRRRSHAAPRCLVVRTPIYPAATTP